MSKQISLETIQALQAMHKDPTKLASELTVRVVPHHQHFHFHLSSPFVEYTLASLEQHLEADAAIKRFTPVVGEYVFRTNSHDDTKCVNAEVADATTVKFLLQSVVVLVANEVYSYLRAAIAEWPSDLKTAHTLKATYSALMRNKITVGSDACTIKVRVKGQKPERLSILFSLLDSFLDNNEDTSADVITIIAFSDNNFCAPAMRAAYADYAAKMLYKDVIPVLFPKIKERVLLMLNIQTEHLAQAAQQKTATTTDPSQTTASDDEVSQPRAAAATSGVVEGSLSEVAPSANGQSTGVTV